MVAFVPGASLTRGCGPHVIVSISVFQALQRAVCAASIAEVAAIVANLPERSRRAWDATIPA